MSRRRTVSLVNSRAASRRRRFRSKSCFKSRLLFEPLEDRRMLTASLSLAGTQTLVAGTNIDASNDHASQQQNMAIDINPTNPLHVTGVSERNTPTTGTALGLYRSADGGRTWATTTIDNSIDSFGAASTRFDPVLGYDGSGKLYVAYGVNDATNTRLVVLVEQRRRRYVHANHHRRFRRKYYRQHQSLQSRHRARRLGPPGGLRGLFQDDDRLESNRRGRLEQWRRQFHRAGCRERYATRYGHEWRPCGWTDRAVVRVVVQLLGRLR